ncbi:MAG: hypothetical protein ABSG74_03430 [Candidatus Bathyarchaeia archaeon]
MRLIIGGYEIPERSLLHVDLSVESDPVSFDGVARQDDGIEIRRRLRLVAQERAIPYEAADKNGVISAGICNIKDLKFEETRTKPPLIRFSGRLIRPFI